MDSAPVSFTKTADGVSIAYMVTGEGEPLVFLPIGITHLQFVRRYDRRLTAWLDELGRRFRLVQYDSRGQGMSQRGLTPDHTMADLELDLEAVLDALKLQRFILVGYFYSAHVAIRYAVKHPDRVRALVLVSCSVSMAAWPLNSMVLMAEQNWEGFLHNWVPASFSPVERDELVNYYKMARTPSDWLISARAFSVSDVAGELSEVRTPTLVLHPRDFIWLRPEESTRVASSIDGARFVLLDGILPFGDAAQAMTIIDNFISDLPEEPEKSLAVRALSMFPDGLTSREVQVLKLLAAGMSNKEIAAELILSPRTIERHVGSIYEKIGTRGRAAAATYAHTRLSD